jgi:hypothetical protein
MYIKENYGVNFILKTTMLCALSVVLLGFVPIVSAEPSLDFETKQHLIEEIENQENYELKNLPQNNILFNQYESEKTNQKPSLKDDAGVSKKQTNTLSKISDYDKNEKFTDRDYKQENEYITVNEFFTIIDNEIQKDFQFSLKNKLNNKISDSKEMYETDECNNDSTKQDIICTVLYDVLMTGEKIIDKGITKISFDDLRNNPNKKITIKEANELILRFFEKIRKTNFKTKIKQIANDSRKFCIDFSKKIKN